MIKIALTEDQFAFFIKNTGFKDKAKGFLRSVYVDMETIKSSSTEAGFTTVRGHQLAVQFEQVIEQKLTSDGAVLTIQIKKNTSSLELTAP